MYVNYQYMENGNFAGAKVYAGSQQTGTIRLEGECAGIIIGIRGREDRASVKSKAASTSYMIDYTKDTNTWKAY